MGIIPKKIDFDDKLFENEVWMEMSRKFIEKCIDGYEKNKYKTGCQAFIEYEREKAKHGNR